MHIATVDGKELTRTLKAINRAPGRKMGDAFWRFGDAMVIEWSGTQLMIEAEVKTPAPNGFMISYKFMRHARTQVKYDGPTDIRWDGEWLHVGSHRIPAYQLEEPRAFALGVDATEADLFRARLYFDLKNVQLSGYGEKWVELEEKLGRSFDKADKALSWTGLPREDLAQLVIGRVWDQAQENLPPPPPELPVTPRPTANPGEHNPTWTFPTGEEHHDLISNSGAGLIFMYVWDALNEQELDNFGIQRRILLALQDLAQRGKKLSHRGFTVFAGDMWPDRSRYGIGLTTTDGALSRVLEKRLRFRSLSGPREGDLSSLYPLFRYDHGNIIVYDDASFRGQSVADDDEWWDTGAVLHFRTFDRISGKSKYGRLV
jgi:hypothetical protein